HRIPSPGPRDLLAQNDSCQLSRTKRLCLAAGAAAECRSTGLATTPANADDPAEVTPAWVACPDPDRVRQAPPPGSTVAARHAAPPRRCSPAWWVGRSLATSQGR